MASLQTGFSLKIVLAPVFLLLLSCKLRQSVQHLSFHLFMFSHISNYSIYLFRIQSSIKVGVFVKIANLFHSLIFYAKSSILDVLQGIITEYTSGQKALNYINLFNIVLSFTCFLTFLMTSEAYSEPIQTSKMALSVKIAKGFKHYCFCKKLHLRCLTGF